MRDWRTVYIIGESRTNLDNAITAIYKSFYMGFEVDVETDKVLDVGCTHTMAITEKFIRDIFIGKSMGEFDAALEREVKMRYHGTSQKAVIVSYKDALKKYADVKQKYFA